MQKAAQRKKVFQQFGAVVLAVVVSLTIVLFRDELARFERYGYPGVFLIRFLGKTTRLFTPPSLAVVLGNGGVRNTHPGWLVAGVGEALGELTGYLAGYGGQAVIEDWHMYERLEKWMQRNGSATILTLSAIPNPFFDLAGIAAGALRFPLAQFLLSCWVGKTIKTIFFAFVGAQFLSTLEGLFGA